MNTVPQDLLQLLEKHNQKHLIECIDKICNEDERTKYINQLQSIDYDLLSHLYSLYQAEQKEKKYKADSLSPITSMYSKKSFDEKEFEKLMMKGYRQISQGKVALLILAGGLGTRLGFDKSKGMFNVDMPSSKTLFEYICNRFLSIQNLSKKKMNQEQSIPCTLFIMTSEHNHNEITTFFKDNNYFHLNSSNIIFFPQTEICALDLEGKIISTEPNKLFQAPDGNGGCFTAMKKHCIMNECIQQGIDYINVISIDNPLSKTLDPLFIGITIEKGTRGNDQMCAKVLKRQDPNERMGNFLNYNQRPIMIEYMELPEEYKTLRNQKGDLVYCASNVLDYMISVNFLKKVLMDDENKYRQLINEFHLLKKKFDVIDESKALKSINGLKFEIFFNSIFEFAEEGGLILLEVEREEEYAPIKNSDQEQTNNPTLTRKKMSNFYKKWYTQAGGVFKGNEDAYLEISFLLSYDGENLFDQSSSLISKEINNTDITEFNGKQGIYYYNKQMETPKSLNK